MVFVAHRRWRSAQASFLWRKEAKSHQRGQAPFDISLAPNAGYLRHLAFVLLLVCGYKGLLQSGGFRPRFYCAVLNCLVLLPF